MPIARRRIPGAAVRSSARDRRRPGRRDPGRPHVPRTRDASRQGVARRPARPGSARRPCRASRRPAASPSPAGPSRSTATSAPWSSGQRATCPAIQTLVGNFVQVGPDGSRTDGRFYLQKPGRVRFEYNPPSPIELIADGSSVVVRDRKLATQDVYPLSQTPLRFLLAERIDLLKDTNVVGAYADDTFVTVVIEEKQTFGGTHRLMLMFGARDNQLRQWTITDPQGYDTTVALYNIDSSKKPDPTLFKIDYTRYVQ